MAFSKLGREKRLLCQGWPFSYAKKQGLRPRRVFLAFSQAKGGDVLEPWSRQTFQALPLGQLPKAPTLPVCNQIIKLLAAHLGPLAYILGA